jgi:hypothetical protein
MLMAKYRFRVKITAFWDIQLCSLTKVDGDFKDAFCPIINGSGMPGTLSQKVVIFTLALRKTNFRFCVFENRMQRRIFEPKWGEETGDCRKLHSDKLRNL